MKQAIIQGLRESGVFSSVIESAEQASLSKDKFLSSAKSSNLTRTSTSTNSFNSRKIGKSDVQATVKTVLEFTDNLTHPLAIPPLSPPTFEDFQAIA